MNYQNTSNSRNMILAFGGISLLGGIGYLATKII